MSEKISEIKEQTMEQKLALNKTICKIIECVYIQELYQSIISTEKLIEELSAEEYLKISEMIRDDLTQYTPQIVLQLVKCLKKPTFAEYINFVMLNIYYYLFLFKTEDYVVSEEMMEELYSLKGADERIQEELLVLIKKNKKE